MEHTVNKIHFFETNIEGFGEAQTIKLTNHTEVSSDDFNHPHGIDFLGNEHFVVANRKGELTFFKLPENFFNLKDLKLSSIGTAEERKIFGVVSGKISSPGNVACYELDKNCYRVLVCNNYQDNVVSFKVDISNVIKIKNEGSLIKRGLHLPDGVAVSPDKKWVAVSCHDSLRVAVYRLSPFLNNYTPPSGILRNIVCPHGVRFSADGKKIFVADGGSQFLHVFESIDGRWNEVLDAVNTIKLVNNDVFMNSRLDPLNRINPEEGGLKGIDFSNNDEILVTTAEDKVLRFFSTKEIMKRPTSIENTNLLKDQIQLLRKFQEIKKKIRRKLTQ